MHLHKYISEKIDMNDIYVLLLPPKQFHFPSINLHAVPYLHGDKKFLFTNSSYHLYLSTCMPSRKIAWGQQFLYTHFHMIYTGTIDLPRCGVAHFPEQETSQFALTQMPVYEIRTTRDSQLIFTLNIM